MNYHLSLQQLDDSPRMTEAQTVRYFMNREAQRMIYHSTETIRGDKEKLPWFVFQIEQGDDLEKH